MQEKDKGKEKKYYQEYTHDSKKKVLNNLLQQTITLLKKQTAQNSDIVKKNAKNKLPKAPKKFGNLFYCG